MKSTPKSQRGVMLLEALIGILIFTIGILALIAMQATAVGQVRDSHYRTEASLLANRMMGEMVLLRNTGSANYSATYSQWQSDVAGMLPNGSGTLTETTSALGTDVRNIRISITWRAPDASADSNHVVVGLLAYNN